jgi:hypothetical protein
MHCSGQLSPRFLDINILNTQLQLTVEAEISTSVENQVTLFAPISQVGFSDSRILKAFAIKLLYS